MLRLSLLVCLLVLVLHLHQVIFQLWERLPSSRTTEFLFKISCRLPPSLVAEEEAVGGLQEEVGVAGEGEANMQNMQNSLNMIGRSSWGGGRKYAKYAK